MQLLKSNNYEPLTWKGGRTEDGNPTAIITCSNGHSFSISHHKIHESGAVEPSVVCPECRWHDFILLLDWAPEADMSALTAIANIIQDKTMRRTLRRTFDEQIGLVVAALSNRGEQEIDSWLVEIRERQAEIMTLLERAQGKAK